LFVLALVGQLIALSAQKIELLKVELGYAPSAITAVLRSRADEEGATAPEPTTQMDDGDGLVNVFPFPIPDTHLIGKMQSLSFGT
jgi:hypothetical protein